jgi:hypothetical protein
VRKRHIVVLSEEERARLHTMIGRGVAPASALTHARVLLKTRQVAGRWTNAIGAGLEVIRVGVAETVRQAPNKPAQAVADPALGASPPEHGAFSGPRRSGWRSAGVTTRPSTGAG